MDKNHLANEKSPYLLQHANNPVHWYPWGQEAFDRAKTTNRLIFLSIGYSTCHWCHVMCHESFENEDVAAVLNNNYVNIKVDREERPDVDKVYMAYVQQISGISGWPLNVFLTPDLKAITGGTYLPPYDKDGRQGFITLLTIIAEQWRIDDKEIAKLADSFLNSLKRSVEPQRGKFLPLPFDEVEWKCYSSLTNAFDEEYKGFGPAPKFVNYGYLDFLLCFYCIHPNNEAGKEALRMVSETLMAIDRGGIHDHIGKGFHRYSVDPRWHVPHFEKMLYDQAQLLAIYAVYHAITGEMVEVIEDIAEYVDNNLTHKSGGFYSAEDADSLPSLSSTRKREGAYYVWTEKEIDEILGDRPISGAEGLTYAEVFKTYFNIKSDGNVPRHEDRHDELKSQNVLMMKESHNVYAVKYEISANKLRDIINEAKMLLREAQKKRPRPHLDNKIITSWNGLMISGLAKAAITLQNENLLYRAQRAVSFIVKHSMENDRLLHVVYVGTDGEVVKSDSTIQAYADDYAFFIQGLLDLYEACFDEQYVKLASDLQRQMDDQFWDAENNGGYHQAIEDPHIIVRIIDDHDGAEPSINSVASMNLVRLYGIINEEAYNERAQKIFDSASRQLSKHPFILAKMITALQKHVHPMKQVIIVGSRNNETTKQMLSLVSKHFDCRRTLISLDPEKDLWLQSVDEHLKLLATSTDVPTAYVCENFGCSLPVTSVKELKNKLDITD